MHKRGYTPQVPILGTMELKVFDYLWVRGPADAKAVHEALGSGTLSTVQSTLNRLHRKGLLARVKVSHAYRYAARVSRQQFIGLTLQDVIARLSGGKLGPLMAGFVDVAEQIDAETLARLEALIADVARRRGNDGLKT